MEALKDFVPAVPLPDTVSAQVLVFGFDDRNLLVFDDRERNGGGRNEERRQIRVPTLGELEALGIEPLRRQLLGYLKGQPVLSLELREGTEVPEGMALRGLRGLFNALSETHFWLAARAVQIVAWDRDHQFCGRCGTLNEDPATDRSKRCPECGLTAYPRLAPAVIVLVKRGDEILLGRSPHFVPGMYSTLAGFVEPGETLEHAVAREIEEEVGVRVKNIRYFGSQPWPFPNSLMVGFLAEWESGEIEIDGEEIEDAGWFTASNLPMIPPGISIARALIDSFLGES
jgi:NAD+ diphosphatase